MQKPAGPGHILKVEPTRLLIRWMRGVRKRRHWGRNKLSSALNILLAVLIIRHEAY